MSRIIITYPEVEGTSHGDDTSWGVNCPDCERRIDYTGFFDKDEINECRCGCEFKTSRVVFEDGSYMV